MLQTTLANLTLDNPVLSASGTFGSGWEGRQFSDLGMVGGLVSKTVTKAPRPGNPPPRILETPAGMLNAIGLENKGADYFLAETLPRMHELAAGGRREGRNGPGSVWRGLVPSARPFSLLPRCAQAKGSRARSGAAQAPESRTHTPPKT